MQKTYYKSLIGIIEIKASEKGISSLYFVDKEGEREDSENEILKECVRQLEEYFDKKRKHFDIALDICGTDFQKKVWLSLMSIPYGKTASYKEIAEAAGHPKAFRAVGAANRVNKIPVIIPCHRVIEANGKLGGYSGGLHIKKQLLFLEGVSSF